MRFESRNSLSDFLHRSCLAVMSSSKGIRPSLLHACLTLPVSRASRSMLRTVVSISLNFAAVSGSSRFTSSDPMNNGSKYDHIRCSSDKMATTSPTFCSASCHAVLCTLKNS